MPDLNRPDTAPKPTPKQLALLRQLAARTGQTFAYPKTRAAASIEIQRLEQAKRTPRADLLREQRAIQRDMAEQRGDAARVREDELAGYGSTATWAGDAEGEPEPEPHPGKPTGQRTELARYQLPDGERIVFGQRIRGVVRVTDKPAVPGAGRSFLIQRGLKSKTELDALVADYVAQSRRRGEPAAIVRVGAHLEAQLLSRPA